VTLYRWDVQKRIATDLVPTGTYYWTNVHYVEADDFIEFDFARNEVFENELRCHNENVHFDHWRCTRLSDGVVVQDNAMSGVGTLTTGD
jgi:hypothetical protein